jgi:3'-5' exonuclease
MAFAIFDVETRTDKHLLNLAFYSAEGIDDEEAYRRHQEQLRKRGNDFFPLAFHVPISIAIGNVGDDHMLRSVESLAEGEPEERLVRDFWERSERFRGCLVSFNGRRFDLPVLELSALRYGIAAPSYFETAPTARERYSYDRHLDLLDFLTNHGAARVGGGLDLLLKMLGLSGKSEMDGSRVQDFYEAGRLAEIHRYCRADVVRTYFLFLRVQLMRGRIDNATCQAGWEAALPMLAALTAPA